MLQDYGVKEMKRLLYSIRNKSQKIVNGENEEQLPVTGLRFPENTALVCNKAPATGDW
jgi:hypothetical protein